MMILIFLN